MKQRIEDWLRERRIERLKRQVLAAHEAGAGNVRDLFELFRAELESRSPHHNARMMADPMSKRLEKANKTNKKKKSAEK